MLQNVAVLQWSTTIQTRRTRTRTESWSSWEIPGGSQKGSWGPEESRDLCKLQHSNSVKRRAVLPMLDTMLPWLRSNNDNTTCVGCLSSYFIHTLKYCSSADEGLNKFRYKFLLETLLNSFPAFCPSPLLRSLQFSTKLQIVPASEE